MKDDFFVIEGLLPNEIYELVVVSINVTAESVIREIKSAEIRKQYLQRLFKCFVQMG